MCVFQCFRKNFVRAGVGRPGGAGSCGCASLLGGGVIYAASSPALAHDGGAAAAACSTCARTRLSVSSGAYSWHTGFSLKPTPCMLLVILQGP
jgi:hypothetical protein